MTANLKPYPAMKDSGVHWLGEVPKHWSIGTLRRRLRPYDGIKIGPFGSQLKLEDMSASGYKVYGQANVIASDFSRGSKFVDSQKFAELAACDVRPGDLVLTMMGTGGRCARLPESAPIGLMDSHLLRLRTDTSLTAEYAALVLDRAPYVKQQVELASKGSIMQGLNSSIVKDVVLVIPPLPEQAAIVRFLDHADRRIRRAIAAKRKLIALLNEEKQAIIQRAVTRGLDPNVPLKPSGVEWLGDVPEHWEVKRLKYVSPEITVGVVVNPSSYFVDQGIPMLLGNNVLPGRFKLEHVRRISPESNHKLKKSQLNSGDVVVVRVGAPGVAAVVPEELDGCNCASIVIVRQGPEVESLWIEHLFNSPVMRRQIDVVKYGAAQKQFNIAHAVEFWALVPSLAEQREILEHLAEGLKVVDVATGHAQREIALLLEYRTRLIADVVTGKLDVREAAAALSAETDDPDPLDTLDALSDGDEEGDDTGMDGELEEADA